MSEDENNQKNYDRQERLKIIEELLEGTTYNNVVIREAIYVVIQTGFDQL